MLLLAFSMKINQNVFLRKDKEIQPELKDLYQLVSRPNKNQPVNNGKISTHFFFFFFFFIRIQFIRIVSLRNFKYFFKSHTEARSLYYFGFTASTK